MLRAHSRGGTRRRDGARVVYAASSASYGDDPADVKREDHIGRPLSMYAATKSADEHYAAAYASAYGLATVGLRYFNVFGARLDPNGAYAAVIPAWATTLLEGGRCHVHGDGSTTRDFCHVANVVGANLLAATTDSTAAIGASLNVGTGERTTLIELHDALVAVLQRLLPYRLDWADATPTFGPFRAGDVHHSRADVGAARSALGFEPVVGLVDGLVPTLAWFVSTVSPHESRA